MAERYLSGKGFLILERNFHSQQGEIDIIAKDNGLLVFVEVKSYSFRSFVHPLAAVSRAKRDSMIHAARTYLYKNGIRDINCRFDVLMIMNGDRFQLIKGAFDAC